MVTPHKCPICLGTGNVPGGFYQGTPGGYPASSACSEQCRSCENGIIYLDDSIKTISDFNPYKED